MSYTGFGATTGGIQYSAGLFRGQAEANARREALAQRKSELAQRMQMAQQEFAAKQMQMQADNAFRDKTYRDKQKAYADSLLFQDKKFNFTVDKYKKGLGIDEERYQDKLDLADRSFNALQKWRGDQSDATKLFREQQLGLKKDSIEEQKSQNLFNQNMAIDKMGMLKQSYEDKRKQDATRGLFGNVSFFKDADYINNPVSMVDSRTGKELPAFSPEQSQQSSGGYRGKPLSIKDQQILAEAEVTVGDSSRTPQERAVAANLIASATGRQSFIGDMPKSQEMGWFDRAIEAAKGTVGFIPSTLFGDSAASNISQAWNGYTRSGALKEMDDLRKTKARILRIAKQNKYIGKDGKTKYYVPNKDQAILDQIESKIKQITEIASKTNI